jgi:DNA-binding response OmpR family regulator
LSNFAPNDSAHSAAHTHRKRRALIIGGANALHLRQQLGESGYDAATAGTATAARMIAEFAPDVAVIVPERAVLGVENESMALARHLREEPATHALPLVLVYGEEERVMRSAALNIGVDDCFGIWTPHEQILARLDALFWRIEAGRRATSMSGDQRLEIDNFIVLLDAVRDDMRAGASGTMALVYAVPTGAGNRVLDKQTRDRTLSEAHGFFKLNLRRVDAVGFYGPTTLLIYMPRMKANVSVDVISKLRDEFLLARTDSDLAIGLAAFPEASRDVEGLIEKAEAAANIARAVTSKKRVIAAIPTAGAKPATAATAPPPPQPTVSEQVPAQAPPTPIQAHASLPTHAVVEKLDAPLARETRLEYETEALAPTPVESNRVTPLPARKAEAENVTADAAMRAREQRQRGAIMPRRLLLTVSDAARMAQLNALIRSAGYEARTAFDGQQALDLLRIERPDLLLLDYELHGIDGVETLRRLSKQNGGRLRLPVVMLMPPTFEVARHEALELGARSVVAMPYDPAELLDSVRRAGSVE